MSNETKCETNYSINNKWNAQQAPHQARHQWRCWLRQWHGAHRALSVDVEGTLSHLMSSRTSLAQDLSLVINISTVIHGRTFPVFAFYPLQSELYPELGNLIVMENLCFSANKGSDDASDVSTSFPQVMSPTSWPSASSTTHWVPSTTSTHHRTRTWMTWHLASCSQRHTENMTITAVRKACPSVSRHRLLCLIEQGNLMEKEMLINQLVVVPQETRAAHSQTEKMVDASGKPDERRQLERTDQDTTWRAEINDYRGKSWKKSRSSRTPSSSCRRGAPFSARRIVATAKRISWSSSTKFNRDYENSRVLPSMLLREENSSRIRTLILELRKIAKWSKLYERFQGFSGCWTNSQWKFPRYQSTSVIPTSSNTWRNVEAFFRIAEPQRRAAKHLGHTWKIGKRFCKSRGVIITLSSRTASMEFMTRRATPFIHSGEKWMARTKSRSEMPVWTVSQKFCHLQWRILFEELWGRPTTTADFGSSLWQVPHGSNAVDQGSGDGQFSGRFEIFVINKRYFNAWFWSTWCENCFNPEQDHP